MSELKGQSIGVVWNRTDPLTIVSANSVVGRRASPVDGFGKGGQLERI